MRRLPYLNGVRAFEAAARLGSFAGAAAELSVTPAAISRMVRLLEERLGVTLFERGANRLTLTAPGRAYQVGLTPILDSLAYLTDQVRSHSGRQVLTVGVGPTFAVRWLIPRLAALNEVAPDLEVRITTGGAAAAFSDDWTCGIRLGTGSWPGLVAERLFSADLVPVCAPRLAERLATPASLKRALLLRVAHAGEDWPLWLKAAGLSGVTATGPTFEYYDHALKAASDGLGVALGIRPYIDDDLRDGRLVAPFSLTVAKGSEWYLIFKESRRGEPALTIFQQWISQTAQM
jgi:LysR family transcriptional regulator, glycine cleavage system transcriptional activator